MRSDSKIPPIGTINNNRKYIGGLESRMSGGHKRNFITVKCMECGLESQIESKGFWNHGCKCNRIREKKRTRHGFSHYHSKSDRFYNIYCGIVSRCRGTSCLESRKWYYDKGIKCLWSKFEDFKNDMYDSYLTHVSEYGEKNTTIDRIDSDGNYCKENCRWATCKEQTDNRKLSKR